MSPVTAPLHASFELPPISPLRPGRQGPRLTFIGGPGVGKTTLALLVAERLGLPLLKEQAREIAREWDLTPATIPDARFMEFQWEILKRQSAIEAAHEATGFVADRCVIDTVAHLRLPGSSVSIGEAEAEAFMQLAARRLPAYDMVVFIPPMFPLVCDGERIADNSFQVFMNLRTRELIDEMQQRHCPDLHERFHVLQSLPLADRVDEVLDALGSKVAVAV